jgi:hypothetical protein
MPGVIGGAFPAEFPIEPPTRKLKIPFRRCERDAQCFGDLWSRKSKEIAHFHYPRFSWIERFQSFQGSVKVEDLLVRRSDPCQIVGEFDLDPVRPATPPG